MVILVVTSLVTTATAVVTQAPIKAQAANPPASGWATITSANLNSNENTLKGVTCLTSTNCWAVGYYCNHASNSCPHDNGPYYQTLIEQYNGTSWSTVTSANSSTSQDNYLTSVACTSSSNCWAVGYYCNGSNHCGSTSYDQTLIEQYNGTSWSKVTSPNTSSSKENVLNAVTCTSSSDCWAVGYSCETTSACTTGANVSNQTLTEHYDGTSWSIVTSANSSASKSNYLTGVTCTSSSNCWASGYYCNGTSTSCPQGNGPYYQTLIEQYNGTSWSVVTSGNVSTSEDNALNGYRVIHRARVGS